jgi:hypothetical protein
MDLCVALLVGLPIDEAHGPTVKQIKQLFYYT